MILDTSAVTALAGGHKTLNLLAGNMAKTPGERLNIRALCPTQAEAGEENLAQRVIRDGYGGPDTCHALYCALPRPEHTGMSILLTGNEDAYPPGVVTVDIDSSGMLGYH